MVQEGCKKLKNKNEGPKINLGYLKKYEKFETAYMEVPQELTAFIWDKRNS